LKQCLTSLGNCMRYTTALRKLTSALLLKPEKEIDVITVYVPEETICKEMESKIE
jgi:hypothetical protein